MKRLLRSVLRLRSKPEAPDATHAACREADLQHRVEIAELRTLLMDWRSESLKLAAQSPGMRDLRARTDAVLPYGGGSR